MNAYEKVAYWITEMECDDPQEEVAWLLAMLDEGGGKTTPTFKENYAEVLERMRIGMVERLPGSSQLKELVVSPTSQINYKKVADWILEECDNPQEEVAWLLAMVDESRKTKPTFIENYENVLDLMEWEESLGFKMDDKIADWILEEKENI